MNIFLLDTDMDTSAQYHCDKHVVKMPLEAAQLASTVLNTLANRQLVGLYKSTHTKHPVTLWAMYNVDIVVEYGLSVAKEYTHRYNKVHASEKILRRCKRYINQTLIAEHTYDITKEIWEDVTYNNAVDYYRQVYKRKYNEINMLWTDRSMPSWLL